MFFRAVSAPRAGALLIAALLAGCATQPPPPPVSVQPRIDGDAIVARDGALLALDVWRAEDPVAVVIALHGMNDYAHAFALPGAWWAENARITTYAYDQRGFGRSPGAGRWAGSAALELDLIAAISAVRAENPGLPVFVIGHSMGAGVVLATAEKLMLDVDGAVLAAPGVWGGSQLPLPYRAALNIAVTFAPGKTLTGERAERQSTDNIPILREMFKDPYVIKDTRIDAIYGVTRLMGDAYGASDEVGGDVLFLLGEKDEIIPIRVMERAAARLCGDIEFRRYDDGWHLLFRDLQAERVWRDIAGWIGERVGKADAAGPTRFGPAASTCSGASQEGAGRRAAGSGQARRPG